VSDNLRRESITAFDASFRAEHLNRSAADSRVETELPVEAGMAEVVLGVAEFGQLSLAGNEGILVRHSLDSMLFRSWLFGILTFLEIRARDLIRHDPDWRDLISENRLEKARAIKDERARRGRLMSTVDALQFGDIGWLAVRYDGWYEYFGVESKKQAKKLVKQLESLRNALAHSQDIVAHDWDSVVAVARSVVAIKLAESESPLA
jgi:hypothetical protein